MDKRRYLPGALLGVIGALLVSSTAFAGAPTGQTLKATVSPAKQSKKAFGPAKLHVIIGTTYSDFTGSPSPRETLFRISRDVKFVNGNLPMCPRGQLQSARTTTEVQANCGASIVGQGIADVNNRTGTFTQPNPVVLVSGGPTTLYIWVNIAGGLVQVLGGEYNAGASTLDITGLPNTPGTDLTLFDVSFLKKKTGPKSTYVMARCKKKKWVHSETTTYYNGQQTSATSKQRCMQR